MADEITLSLGFNYSKNGALIQRSLNATLDVSGDKAIQNIQNIGTGDETLALGDVATNGILLLHNLEAFVEVTTPGAPTISNQGTPASTTISYKIVAKQSDGSYSAASSAGTTTTAAATLTGVNFNRLTWTDQTAATGGFDIYRTAAGGTPSTTGKIGSVAAGVATFDDTGLAGDSGTAPATGVDNVILLGADGSSYPNKLKGEEFALVRWNGAAIHGKGNTIACDLEYVLIEN